MTWQKGQKFDRFLILFINSLYIISHFHATYFSSINNVNILHHGIIEIWEDIIGFDWGILLLIISLSGNFLFLKSVESSQYRGFSSFLYQIRTLWKIFGKKGKNKKPIFTQNCISPQDFSLYSVTPSWTH